MENVKKKKPVLFKIIETKEEALKTIKDASYAFLFVAVPGVYLRISSNNTQAKKDLIGLTR